jgi:hypothetical protein
MESWTRSGRALLGRFVMRLLPRSAALGGAAPDGS